MHFTSYVLQVKRDLCIIDSPGDKEVVHCEFDVSNSGIVWTSGKSLQCNTFGMFFI